MLARPRAAAVIIILALFLSGCSRGGNAQEVEEMSRKLAQEKDGRSEAARIADEIRQDPRIEKSDVIYVDEEASFWLDVSSDDRDQVEEIVALCTRKVWLSRIAPLKSIPVHVTLKFPNGRRDFIDRDLLDSPNGADVLLKSLGKRPAPYWARERQRLAAQQVVNGSETTRIAGELRRDQRFKQAEVGYENGSGTVSIRVSIDPDGSDREQLREITDFCTRKVWLSQVSPLESMAVLISWNFPDGTGDSVIRYPLESRYAGDYLTKTLGKRPVSPPGSSSDDP